MKTRLLWMLVAASTLVAVGCGKPGQDGLKDSFAQQLAANSVVKSFERQGDTFLFTGPGVESDQAKWRVRIDTIVIEPNDKPSQPFKGTVTSSWYADERIVRPRGRESNLPPELTSNGLGQACWAFWDTASQKWTWE